MKTLRLTVGSARTADVGPLVPVEAEPFQIANDRGVGVGRRSLDVGVLDAKDQRAAVAAREQPVEKGRARVAHVQLAGWTRSEADAHE